MPPKFLEYLVILCFERRYLKQNPVARLQSNISPKIPHPQFLGWLHHGPQIWVPVPHTYISLWAKWVVPLLQWSFVFNGPNRSGTGAGAKNFYMLDPAPYM